jgi:putative peptidoglycan lipid II flippase
MSLARNIATVGSATLLSRLLGFFRDVGIAAVLGAGALSDAYFAALQIPNLFRRLLAEGALNSAFVPMWIRIKEENGAHSARRFGEEALGSMLLGLGAIAFLCVLFAPMVVHLLAPGFLIGGARELLAIEYVRLSAPYVAIVGLIAVAASVLNAEGRVGAAAFGLVVFNCVFLIAVGVVLVLGIGVSVTAGLILSAAVALAGIGQLFLVCGALLRLPTPLLRPRLIPSAATRRFFALAVPGVIAGGIPQLKLMAGAMVASSSQASVSWLYYANRLYELPLGMVSIAIAAVMVPLIAASVRAREPQAIAAAQSRAFEIALGLALPAAVAFALLAEPIAGGLFQRGAFGARDTAAVAAALAAICAGLPGHVLEKVFGAVSFAHEDTRTPMYAALAGLVTAITGALLLFPTYGHVGVAAAIAISGWVGALLLGIVLLQRRWLRIDGEGRRRLPLIVLATAVMALVIHVAQESLVSMWDVAGSGPARIATLAVLVVLGLATYGAMLHLTKAVPLRELFASIMKF